MGTANDHTLKAVETDSDWESYHRIRRTVLFEERGLLEYYDPNHPDEYVENFHPLLLVYQGVAIGTVRFDVQPEGFGIVRLVAIDTPVQGQGHGTRLMALIEEMARSMDLPVLELNSAHDAVPFYERLSYQVIEPGERCILMRKSLSDTAPGTGPASA